MEPIRSSSSGFAHHHEDSWTCHRCGWVYPNPHPSAKHRRSHKKHCGKIKGFEVHSHSESQKGGSSEEASSDDESHAKIESLAQETPQSLPTASPMDLAMTNLGEDKHINPEVALSRSKDMPVTDVHVPMLANSENSTPELSQSIPSPPGGEIMQENVVDKVELPVPDKGMEEVCKQHDKPEDPSGTWSPDLTSFEGVMKTPDLQGNMEAVTSLEVKEEHDPSTNAEQEGALKSKDADSKHVESTTSSGVSEAFAEAGGVSFAAAEEKAEPAAHGSRGLNMVLDQAKQAHKPDIANAPRIQGGDLHPHDSWVCHRCGWTYPNPHPSAKHRRNHKKHCGKLKGFELRSEIHHQGGSSDEVSSDEEGPNRKEHLPPQPPQIEQQAGGYTNVSMAPPTSLTGKINVESETNEVQGKDLSVSKGDGELLVSPDAPGVPTPDISLEVVPSFQQAAETLQRPNPGNMVACKSDEWDSNQANQQSSLTEDVSVNEEPAHSRFSHSLGLAISALKASDDISPPVEQTGASSDEVYETRVKDAEDSINEIPGSFGEGDHQQSVCMKDTGQESVEVSDDRMVEDSEKQETKENLASELEGVEKPVENVLNDPVLSTPLEGPCESEGPVVLESKGPVVLENVLNYPVLSTPLEGPCGLEGPVVLEKVSNDLSPTPLLVEDKMTGSVVPITTAKVNDLKCDAEKRENINDEVDASAASVVPVVLENVSNDLSPTPLQVEEKVTGSAVPITAAKVNNPLPLEGPLVLENVSSGLSPTPLPVEDKVTGSEVPITVANDPTPLEGSLVPEGPVVLENVSNDLSPTPLTVEEVRGSVVPIIAAKVNALNHEAVKQDKINDEVDVSTASVAPTLPVKPVLDVLAEKEDLTPSKDDKPQEIPSDTIVQGQECNALNDQGAWEEKSSLQLTCDESDGKPHSVAEGLVVSARPTHEVEASHDSSTLKPRPPGSKDGIGDSEIVKHSRAEGVPPPMVGTGKTTVMVGEVKPEGDEGKPQEVKAEEVSVVRKDSDAMLGSRCDSLEIYEDAQDTLETCSVGGSVDEENEASEGAQEEIKHLDQGTTLAIAKMEDKNHVCPDITTGEEEKGALPVTTYAPKTKTEDLRAPSPEAWQELPGPVNVKPVVESNTTPEVTEVTGDGKSVDKKMKTTSEVTEDGKSGDSHTPLRSLMVKEAAEKKDRQVADANMASGDRSGSNRKTDVSGNGTTKSKSRSFWSHCICCPTVH